MDEPGVPLWLGAGAAWRRRRPRRRRACAAAACFADIESRSFLEPRDWSFEDILGYLKSTSVSSEKALGKDFAAFAAELGAALAGCGEGKFHEDLKCGYTIGRKRR
jgi:hypothetical protein